MTTTYIPRGVIPANLLPFTPDFAIDEAAYRQHLHDLVAIDGITAITTNGHAAEIHALTSAEQRHVLDITLDEVGDCLPIISGIYADDSLHGARLARQAQAAGARALLIFPPQPFILGAQRRPEMVVTHYAIIAEATDLPLIAFNYPLASGQGYTPETLVRLAETVPSVVAMKDWCNDVVQHEKNLRTMHSLGRPFAVLSTHSAWLLPSLILGCDGLLSGMGSVVAELQVALWEAVQQQELVAAQRLNDLLWPLTQAFYAPPAVDMHNRMKEALVLLGRQQHAVVRPPLVPITPEERARLRVALCQAQLLTLAAVDSSAGV
jgi:4-hydroxy-tetrahydrodipicolinate synthase